MKTRNIKQFKELILRYESIELAEIVESEGDPEKLTGFGRKDQCTLCTALKGFPGDSHNDMCEACIWHRIVPRYLACRSDKNAKTYSNIGNAFTSQMLLKAFKARAKYMRSVLKKLRIKQP